MFKPYETTYGNLININKIEQALIAYITTNDIGELEFEYPIDTDVRCVYITGYNQEEADLPIWEHPIVIKTLNGTTVVVTDVRKFVTKTTELPARLSDIVRDKNSLSFVVLRALLTKDGLSEDFGKHRTIYKPTATAMGAWISSMVNTIVTLDPIESFAVEIVCNMYANTLFYTESELKDNLDTIIARVITSKHVYNISKKEVKSIGDNYVIKHSSKNLDTSAPVTELTARMTTKLDELVINIQKVTGDKGSFITVDSLIGVLGNLWYGPGGLETPIMALEDMATWNAMLYMVLTNRSYQKSRLGMLLSKHKRVIDAKLIDKHFTNYLQEVIVE